MKIDPLQLMVIVNGLPLCSDYPLTIRLYVVPIKSSESGKPCAAIISKVLFLHCHTEALSYGITCCISCKIISSTLERSSVELNNRITRLSVAICSDRLLNTSSARFPLGNILLNRNKVDDLTRAIPYWCNGLLFDHRASIFSTVD